jgi:hypothetical protein
MTRKKRTGIELMSMGNGACNGLLGQAAWMQLEEVERRCEAKR